LPSNVARFVEMHIPTWALATGICAVLLLCLSSFKFFWPGTSDILEIPGEAGSIVIICWLRDGSHIEACLVLVLRAGSNAHGTGLRSAHVTQ
jgi:hypothetical protein